jgi:hypothetical protein
VKHAVEMGSGITIYIPGFMNIGTGIQKFLCRGYIDRHLGRRLHKSALGKQAKN